MGSFILPLQLVAISPISRELIASELIEVVVLRTIDAAMWWEFQSTLRNALTDTHAQTKKAKRAADTEIYGAFVLRGLASIVTWSLYLFFFF